MDCPYFKKFEKIGSCPFTFSCKEECFYVYKEQAEDYESLLKEKDYLQQEIWSKESELNNLESENDDLSVEITDRERELDKLLILCKNLLKYIDTEYYHDDLEDEIYSLDIGWGSAQELKRLI